MITCRSGSADDSHLLFEIFEAAIEAAFEAAFEAAIEAAIDDLGGPDADERQRLTRGRQLPGAIAPIAA